MTGAIIIITICYYLIDYGLGWGLRQAQIYNPWIPQLIPPLLAGYLGALQFIRTERILLRPRDRFVCTFKSCVAIVFAPLVFIFVLLAAGTVVNGLAGLIALPNLAAWLTLAGLLPMLIFTLYALPMIYIGMTLAQWIKAGRLTW